MQNYHNPILTGDFSDPDVIRVADDFYMISSSFTYFPGIPLLHSRDMLHWRIINHVAKQIPFPAYRHTMHKKGLWAPSLRYHEGIFYVYVCMPDEGLLLFRTTDLYGEWECCCVKNVCGWIDPCPLWEEDGTAYLVHGIAKSRLGYNSRLYVHRMSADGREILDSGVMVFDGGEENRTTEGPKFYQRGGYYYILCPAGGVKYGWQLALRSMTPFGPYEYKRVLQQGTTQTNGPHQGGYVEGDQPDCGWFFHFQDMDAYGRIIHLQPVQWVDGWPLIGELNRETGIGEPVLCGSVPYEPTPEFYDPKMIEENRERYGYVNLPDISDSFSSAVLAKSWQWQALPQREWYSLTDSLGHLRLFSQPCEVTMSLFHAPWFLSHCTEAFQSRISVRVALHSEQEGDRAGIAMFGYRYSYLAVMISDGKPIIRLINGTVAEEDVQKPEADVQKQNTAAQADVQKQNTAAQADVQKPEAVMEETIVECSLRDLTVIIQMEFMDSKVRFYYQEEGKERKAAGGSLDMNQGGWTGARAGIFCGNFNGVKSAGYADYSDYRVENNTTEELFTVESASSVDIKE